MASFWVQETSSGRYRGFYRDADGKTRGAGTFDLKRQARAAAAGLAGESYETPIKSPTVDEWLPEWRARRRKVEERTWIKDMYRYNKHIKPVWGDRELQSITSGDVQKWVNDLAAEGQAAGSVRLSKLMLSSICKTAVMAKAISSNPCSGVDVPRIAPLPDKYLTVEDCAKLLTVLDGDDADAFEVLVGTGMRWGEFMGAHHDQVLDGEFLISRAYVPVGRYMKPPKDYEIRSVPLSSRVQSILERRPDMGVPTNVDYRDIEVPDCGLLFPNTVGRPWAGGGNRFLDTLQAAAKVTGLKRKVTAQDLRHTYASQLVQKGIPIFEVQKLMGHQSVNTTQRYARVGRAGWDDVRKALFDAGS